MSKKDASLGYPAPQNHNLIHIQHLAKLAAWADRIAVGTVLLLVLVIAIQLMYPGSITRPFLKISGMSYGFVSIGQLDVQLRALDDQTQTLKLAQKTYQTTAHRMGMHIDAEQVRAQAMGYSWKQRLVPFSLFNRGISLTPSRLVDDKILSNYAEKLIAENTTPAKNAELLKNLDGSFGFKPGIQGAAYAEAELKKTLTQLPFSTSAIIKLSGKKVLPAITDEELAQVTDEINNLVKQDITIIFGSQKIVLTGGQIKAWADVSADEATGTVEVTYNQNAMEAWLGAKAPLVVKAAIASQVYRLDGSDQRQMLGTNGQALDTYTTAQSIIGAAKQQKSEVQAAVVAVAPGQRIIRSYSPTGTGVAVLISDWQAERKGAQTAVYFQEIGGSGRAAESAGSTSLFAASIYKLFIAYYLLHGIETQTINPADPVTGGKDIAGCIQAMIVVSDNACPEALANRFGWNTINSFIAANGFGASSVKNGNNTVTAASVGNYLIRLHAGGLLNQTHTATLLGYMAQQKYRSAIPAGLPGVVVQDKVGFYGSTWHDAAIVRSKKATYVLVILTKGSSPSAMADLAKRIDAIL